LLDIVNVIILTPLPQSADHRKTRRRLEIDRTPLSERPCFGLRGWGKNIYKRSRKKTTAPTKLNNINISVNREQGINESLRFFDQF